jgi:hypothetical protein
LGYNTGLQVEQAASSSREEAAKHKKQSLLSLFCSGLIDNFNYLFPDIMQIVTEYFKLVLEVMLAMAEQIHLPQQIVYTAQDALEQTYFELRHLRFFKLDNIDAAGYYPAEKTGGDYTLPAQ